MEPYVSFDDALLDGVAPLERFLKDQSEETIPDTAWLTSTSLPIEEAAAEETALVGGSLEELSTPQTPCKEQTTRVEASPIQFPGWRDGLHLHHHPGVPLESIQKAALPPGFKEVMACI